MSQEDHKDEPAALPAAADASTTALPPTMQPSVSPPRSNSSANSSKRRPRRRAKNHDLFLRERAEVENFKKRMQREKAEALRFASEPLVRDLLPVVDNLERAVEHADGNGQSVLEGVRLVLKSLLDILERHGVKRLEAVGERVRSGAPRGDGAGRVRRSTSPTTWSQQHP